MCFDWVMFSQVPPSMIEPHDPVLIKSDSTSSSASVASGYSGPARLLYSAQLGLRFKMQSHLFLSPTGSSDQLELTCVSRVGGLRKGGDAGLVEGRAKWIIRQHPAKDDGLGGGGSSSSSGIRRQAAQTVDNWAGISSRDDDVDYDDDVDVVDQLGGVGGRRSKEKIQPEGNEEEDDDEDAQSISDSENPSRRTQPVVGSHPGKKKLFSNF